MEKQNEPVQCPECGHVVAGFFDHIHIDCEHDMTPEEIKALLDAADEDGDAT